jgi:hypothetical protein
VALPAKSTVGNSAAPASLLFASACMMRPMAAPMSRLLVCASSMSLVSSGERKARHQSSAGGDLTRARRHKRRNVDREIRPLGAENASGQHLHQT